MPVARQALVDDLPGGYVEGSKECRRAVTFESWVMMPARPFEDLAGCGRAGSVESGQRPAPGDRRRDPPRRATFQRSGIST